MVSISGSSTSRNVTLGQGQSGSLDPDVFDTRLRATGTTVNGKPSLTTPAGSATTSLTHVVFTRAFDGVTTTYVDGVAVAVGDAAGTLANWDGSMPLVLGNEVDGSRGWLGRFCLAAVYDVALSTAQVQQNTDAGCAAVDVPPVAVDDTAEVVQGESVVIDVAANDEGMVDPTTIVIDTTPGLGTTDVDAGQVTYTSTGATGTDTFTYTIADDDGDRSTPGTVTVEVRAGNAVPVLTSPGDQTSDEGDTVSLPVQATDANGDPLLYAATDLPPGLTIDPATGEISGTLGQTTAGTYPTSVSVDDGAGGTDTTSWTWTVNAVNVAPILDPIDDQQVATGTVSLQVVAEDPDGDTITYAASGLPAGTTIDPATGLISGTATAGDYTITITASDPTDGQSSEAFVWSVVDVVLEPIVEYRFDEAAGTTVADSSGVGTPLDLTIADPANVTWLLNGLQIDTETVIATAGPATKVNQAITTSGAVTVDLYVQPATVTQDGPARILSLSETSSKRNLTVGHGTTGSSPTTTYDVRLRATDTSGNGTPSTTTPAGTLTDQLQHVVYTRDVDGTTQITIDGSLAVSGTAGGDLSTWASDMPLLLGNEVGGGRPWLGTYCYAAIYDDVIAIADLALRQDGCELTSGNAPPTVDPIGDRTDQPGDVIDLAASASDPDGDPVTFTATGLPPGIAIDTNGIISGTIDTAADGDYQVTVTATDPHGATGNTTFTWTVEPAPAPQQEFEFTGAPETFVVPDGVSELWVDVAGAQGGGAAGGPGGRIEARVAVTPGQELTINVGGRGDVGQAGWNHGGAGTVGNNFGGVAFGGGGRSDVLATDGSPLVIAGGGGGSSRRPGRTGEWGESDPLHSAGGAGGGVDGTGQPVADRGQLGTLAENVGPLGGGQASATGAAAWCYRTCSGAGGGGYRGGNIAGQTAGGGGGSGFVDTTQVSDWSSVTGARLGHGSVTISFEAPAETTDPEPGDVTFDATGELQSFAVPAGVTSVRARVWGAQGGNDRGGLGGYVDAVVPTTPGETLMVVVGGRGGDAADGGDGGFNGGGNGWTGNATTAGGGGASDIRRDGTHPEDRIIVAGGGGGPGACNTAIQTLGGAGSGTPLGGDGSHSDLDNHNSNPGVGGGGTTNWTTPHGENSAGSGLNGGAGGGWIGGTDGTSYHVYDCWSGGAGGGSGHVADGLVQVAALTSVQPGDGRVELSWPVDLSPVDEPDADSTEFLPADGEMQFWTVPDGVRAVLVETYGAKGGGVHGGLGGYTAAAVAVQPGQTVSVFPGESGDTDPPYVKGGFSNGGGTGAKDGSDGGAASDVRIGGIRVADRVVVAGGGGGQSRDAVGEWGYGGDGGGLSGEPGGPNQPRHGRPGSAPPGTQSTGIHLPQGGQTGSSSAGAGGGGYRAGDHGTTSLTSNIAGGGAGGSGHVAPGAISLANIAGANNGAGKVRISWPIELPDLGESFGDPYGEIVDGVQIGSGNLVESATDATIAVVGPSLGVERTYNSLDERVGLFGRGWSTPFDMSVEDDPAAGQVVVVYPDGRREVHTDDGNGGYDTRLGWVSELADVAGGGWTLTAKDDTVRTFDATGRLTTIEDIHGRRQQLTYDSDGLTEATDATSGRSLTFDVQAGRVLSVTTTDPGNGDGPAVWRYGYDGDRLERVCDARDNDLSTGSCTVYSADSDGRLDAITLPEGNTVRSVVYDDDGRVESVTNGVGDTTDYSYGSYETTVTDARGFDTVYSYDAYRRTTRILDPEGFATLYEYDDEGFRSGVTDGNGNRADLDYDKRGNLLSSRDAAGNRSYSTFDADDNLIESRDARSAGPDDDTFLTTRTYSAARELLTETSPPTADQPSGVTTTRTYTAGGEDHGFGPVPPGLLRTVSDGVGTITNSYDDDGDLRRTVDQLGLTTTFDHDGLGRVVSETTSWAGGSATTTRVFDAIGNEVAVTGPATVNAVTGDTHQIRTTQTFDGNSRVVESRVRDVGGAASPTPTRVTTMTYDDADRQLSVTDPAGGVMTRTYDPAGNVATVTDAEGRTLATSYDGRGLPTRIVQVDFDQRLDGTLRDVVLAEYSYDGAGNRTSQRTPPPGDGTAPGQDVSGTLAETTITYDGLNRPLVTTALSVDRADNTPVNVTLSNTTYDAVGNVTRQLTGRIGTGAWESDVTSTYDAANQLTREQQTVDGTVRATGYVYDGVGRLVERSVTGGSALVAQTRWTHDAAGNVLSTTVENGTTDITTWTARDERGLPVGHTSGRANSAGQAAYTTTFEYDANGALVRTLAPPVVVDDGTQASPALPAAVTARPTTLTGYDALGNATHERDPRGHTTVTDYDLLNRPVTITHPTYTPPDGSPAITATEQFAYDKVGNLTSRVDRRGHTTNFVFDDRNRPVSQTDPAATAGADRGVHTSVYDDAGNVVATVSAEGIRTEMTHDDLGRVVTSTAVVRDTAAVNPAARHTTTYVYDAHGRPVTVTDPTGVTQTATYNRAGEQTRRTDADGNNTVLEYDAAGRPVATVDPAGRRGEIVYDLAGRPIEQAQIGPDTIEVSRAYTTYDADGNPVGARDARSSGPADDTYLVTSQFDALGRITQTTSPGDGTTAEVVRYRYDAAGNPTRIVDARGEVTSLTYQPWGLPETTVEPPVQTPAEPVVRRSWTTVYDVAGQPVVEQQPGIEVTRTFDRLGRLTGEAGTGAGVTDATIGFGYDLDGRRIAVSHPDGQIDATLDDRSLPVRVTTPGQPATVYGYDDAGRLTSRTDPAGTATFTYDNRGLLDTISDPLTSGTVTYGHDTAGLTDRVTYQTVDGTMTRSYGYDGAARLVDDQLHDDAGTPIHTTAYGYLPTGQLDTRQVTAPATPAVAGSHAYTYEPGGRLASWTDPAGQTVTYGYDGAGNRTTAGDLTATFDARNRLVATTSTDGDATYIWSDASHLTGVDDGTGPQTIGFDGLGRMTSWGPVDYRYDGLGRLVDRTETGTTDPFGYAGLAIDPVTAHDTSYTRTPAGGLVSMTDTIGDAGWVGRDRHGDIAWTADPTTTSIGAATSYTPWGVQAATAGHVGPLGFQGDLTDPTSGLVWQGARWYSPELAIFTARDTVFGDLATPMSLNRFTYGFADPLRYFDPDGRYGFDGAQVTVDDDDGWEATKTVLENNDIVDVNGNARTVPHQTDARVFESGAQQVQMSLAATAERIADDPEKLALLTAQLENLDTYRLDLTDRFYGDCDARCLAAGTGRAIWNFGRGAVEGATNLGATLGRTSLCGTGVGYLTDRTYCIDQLLAGPRLAAAAVRDPAGTARNVTSAAFNREAMDEGVAYWLGSFVPDLVTGAIASKAITTSSKAAQAAKPPAPEALVGAGDDLTRVGRWMSPEEHLAMVDEGFVQPGRYLPQTYVASPPDVEAFMGRASPGARYLEFDVPTSSLVQGGKEGAWASIPGPDLIFSRLRVQRGLPPFSYPPATNIEWLASRIG